MEKEETVAWEAVRAALKKIWGYEDFRAPQGEIIRSLLQKRDALIVLPTGGGKSICFQLPALLQKGLTLVVSPLIALMENQVQELRDRNLPAGLLHAEIPSNQRKKILQDIKNNRLRLLYLSPETLLSQKVWAIITQPQVEINGIILDEAHCLVQWGETFRAAYRRLGAVRLALLQSKPPGTKIALAAFTATADTETQQIIKNVLQLQCPEIFLNNPYRPNLYLNVKITCTPAGRKRQLLKFIKARENQAGLVYARTRHDSENLAEWLRQNSLATAAYHAGLSAACRREIETNWLSGKLKFVVCTSAFGMGINKPDARWVLHFQAPALLSEYIQEVGRAGRDGKPAEALTLISEPTGLLNPEDKQRLRFFEEKLRSLYRRAGELAKKIPPSGEVEAIARQYKDGALALSLLHSAGKLTWRDPFHYQIKKSAVGTLSFQPNKLSQDMINYLKTRRCRWQFLLEAFGFAKEAPAKGCGHCDNCKRGISVKFYI
ncbi:MAG: ATP-dependent DNA helicase [Oscillatoriaceae bacterium SKW80]|nr:ATP-dependent DNA helicase [Oscillatoriaceae bacterium SKYG93]MCX8121333.1 ATP-dependent DNA helicase [Oscillatoriaceae bacterium SKW80]MDW8453333.1 ATP-dependent DNA helicase RecQ [Oscillatoriaceae cyanobacterium SKYGB_i_bin93]HIK26687.1 ATP-dependent DNA helicase RecQ [Oscillatoriaceae cyanobacterium M7585_C2015_266]